MVVAHLFPTIAITAVSNAGTRALQTAFCPLQYEHAEFSESWFPTCTTVHLQALVALAIDALTWHYTFDVLLLIFVVHGPCPPCALSAFGR